MKIDKKRAENDEVILDKWYLARRLNRYLSFVVQGLLLQYEKHMFDIWMKSCEYVIMIYKIYGVKKGKMVVSFFSHHRVMK